MKDGVLKWWKKADLVTDLMCVSYESVESKITPRLRTSEDSEMLEPSTWRTRSPTLWSRFLGATTSVGKVHVLHELVQFIVHTF